MNLERTFEKAIDSTYYIYNKLPYKWFFFIIVFTYNAYIRGINNTMNSLILALEVFLLIIGGLAVFFIVVNLLMKAGEHNK